MERPAQACAERPLQLWAAECELGLPPGTLCLIHHFPASGPILSPHMAPLTAVTQDSSLRLPSETAGDP